MRKTTGHLTGSCGETPEPRNPRLVLFQIQHERVCVCVCLHVCLCGVERPQEFPGNLIIGGQLWLEGTVVGKTRAGNEMVMGIFPAPSPHDKNRNLAPE